MANKWSANPNAKLLIMAGVFIAAYFIPFANPVVSGAMSEAFLMLSEYAQQHVLLCLVPAFFIAGAIMVFLNQQSIIKYLGPKANKVVAYSVASFSGAILAVCSCTVLPIFKGIYKKGAGLGPAVSFLYSGPAINVLAIVLTAKVLGPELGIARGVGAIVFAFVIGIIMHLVFRKEDVKRTTDEKMFASGDDGGRPLFQTTLFVFSMIGILVFLNWAPSKGSLPVWDFIYNFKFIISGIFGIALVIMLVKWFRKDELGEWVSSTRDFSLQILPLLFGGVLIAGFLLGRPGHRALIPEEWIVRFVGDNSLLANFAAAVSGALMYFATLTEVPIMQGLIGAGMAKGPALALLLAGPSLSLPSMIVIGFELGLKKTFVYIMLVVVLSTLVGFGFGLFFIGG